MTFELNGENPPCVLSEIEASSCAPLNQCDIKSRTYGNSMIIANTLFMYHVDYNEPQLSHQNLGDNILFDLCRDLWAWFYVCVCIYYSPHSY